MDSHNLQLEWLDPNLLTPNDWNVNTVSPENEAKIEESLRRHEQFKPVIVRTLADGTLEILGGEHRTMVARRLGMKIMVLNLGQIDDKRAKEISLVDNGRYGADDALKLADLLNSLGSHDDLSGFLPYSDGELSALLSSSTISLDDLELPEEDERPTLDPTLDKPKSGPTHQVMRFRVPVEDADGVQSLIEKTMKRQGFTSSDSLTNAGDALVWLCNRLKELGDE